MQRPEGRLARDHHPTLGPALGGGRSVIIGDPSGDKFAAMFESFGRLVAGLGGRYITEHVHGVPETCGGDPSPVT